MTQSDENQSMNKQEKRPLIIKHQGISQLNNSAPNQVSPYVDLKQKESRFPFDQNFNVSLAASQNPSKIVVREESLHSKEEHIKNDPLHSLNHLQKVRVKAILQNTTITPYDQSSYIQVLVNPEPQGPSGTQEIITVQLIKPSIKQYDKQKAQEGIKKDRLQQLSYYRSSCSNGHEMSKNTNLKSSDLSCTLCESTLEDDSIYFKCDEGCSFTICEACNLKHYIRHALRHQTSQHHFYKQYELEAVTDRPKDEEAQVENHNDQLADLVAAEALEEELAQLPSELQIENAVTEMLQKSQTIKTKNKIQKRLDGLEQRRAFVLQNPTKTAKSLKLANVVKEGEPQFLTNNEVQDLKKFVVVGFWSVVNGSYRCYRVFKIKGPSFLKIKEQDRVQEQFLHIGAQNELFYFTKKLEGQKSSFTCNLVDLNKATTTDELDLKKVTANFFELPLKDSFLFETGTELQDLMSYILLDLPGRVEATAYLQLLTLANKKMLVITAPLTVLGHRGEQCVRTLQNNLIFVDLQKRSVEFVIYDADLLLNTNSKDEKQETPSEILFLRRQSIILMEWGSPIDDSEHNRMFLQTSAPFQLYLKSYSLLPQPDITSFSAQRKELDSAITNCLSRKSLILGQVHKSQKRISIIYRDGGLFTFDLAEKAPFSQGSSWQGEIGEVIDFNWQNFVIKDHQFMSADGKDSRGFFKVSGQILQQKTPWTGYYEDKRKHLMIFQEFTIQKNGQIEAKGEDDAGAFQITGKMEINQNQIKFVKQYAKHKVFYQGVINPDRNKIVGQCGKTQDLLTMQFQLNKGHQQDVKMKIEYSNEAHSWIQLSGVLDMNRATLQGTFTVSDDLSDTFIVDTVNFNKNIFLIVGQECQDRGIRVFGSAEMSDAQFCSVNQQDYQQVWACGNLRLQARSKHQIIGYSTVEFDLQNLDTEGMVQTSNKKVLECQVPLNFQETIDDSGQPQLPYYVLTRFYLQFKNLDEVYFKTQMFYQDALQNNRKVLFLNGTHQVRVSKDQIVEYQKKRPLPEWPATMTDNYTVSYPILAYKSNLPSDNELVICNMITNQPQKFINISPYRFVQFVETGLNPERYLNTKVNGQAINTSIFLLVEHNSLYYLISYRCFPWPIDRNYVENQRMFQFHDQIQLITGHIDPDQSSALVDRSRLTAEKIITASMLQRPSNTGVQIMVVLQLIDEIIYYNLTRPQLFGAATTSMIRLSMQRGPDEQIYFGETNDAGTQQISQLTFVEKDQCTVKVAYCSDDAQILAFQVEYNENSTEKTKDHPHWIYVLDSKLMLKRVSVTKNQEEEFEFKIQSKIDLSFHPGIQKLTTSLALNNWNKVILNSKAIIGLQFGKKLNEQVATVLSTRSTLQYKHQYFGFDDDRKVALLQQGRTEISNRSSSVLSILNVPWIGKNLFEIKESRYNYFMIQSSICSKKIYMMRVDTAESLSQEKVLLGNSQIGILLKNTHQYMLFNQQDFMFAGNYFTHQLIPLTNVENGIQYFIEKSNTNYGCHSVIKVEKFSKKTRIYENLVLDFKNLIQKYLTFDEFQFFQSDDISKIWALERYTEQLTCFIFSQRTSQSPVKELEKQFIGSQVEISVYIVNDQKQKEVQGLRPKPFLNKFSKENQSNVPQYKPAFCLLECDYWPLRNDKKVKILKQCLFTKDFLVIKYGSHVYYQKVQEILNARELAYNDLDSGLGLDPANQFLALYRERKCKVLFDLLNMDYISDEITKHDFQVIAVSNIDIQHADKAEDRKNVIQICFSELAIMWDLDENKEVTFISKPSDFSEPTNYFVTGFVMYTQNTESKFRMRDSQFFTQNEDRSLIMSPQTQRQDSIIFRNFALINFMDVLDIIRRQENSLYISDIDPETMVQNFNGLTFFQIFRDNEDYLEILYKQIKQPGIQEKVNIDEMGIQSDNILIRQIYWAFNFPIVPDYNPAKFQSLPTSKTINRPNILQSSMFDEDNQHMLDPLLRLLMLSSEFRLSDLVANFECFKQVFNIQSQQINVFLEESHFENSQSEEVTSLKWNPKHSLITFGSDFSFLGKEQIIEQVQQQQFLKLGYFRTLGKLICKQHTMKQVTKHLKTFPVRVRIIEIEWLSDCLKQFYLYLQKIDDDSVFGNDFIRILLEQQNYTDQLFIKVFLPYLAYMIICLVYFSYYVPYVQSIGGFTGDGSSDNQTQANLRLIILIGAVAFLCVEVKQISTQGFSYFKDLWNYIYWAQHSLSIFIVVRHGGTNNEELTQEQKNNLLQICSVTIVLLWLMLYYWLRLFPMLAFYITMISETLKDISNFFIMFCMCVCMFANASYVLQAIQFDANDANSAQLIIPELWTPQFNVPFLDSVLNQYQIGLGSFNIVGQNEDPGYVLLTIYFLLASFFTQMMFVNMIIAIMSETYSRVSEAKERNALMERSHLYADFMWGIRLTKALRGKRYLYVVRPDNSNESETDSAVQQAESNITDAIKSSQTSTSVDLAALQHKVTMILSEHHEMKESLKKIDEDVNSKLQMILDKLGIKQ